MSFLATARACGLRTAAGRFDARAWDEVPPSVEVRQLALRLLRTHPLRAADALQLAAALTLSAAGLRGLHFACADERLKTAAEIEGLEVI